MDNVKCQPNTYKVWIVNFIVIYYFCVRISQLLIVLKKKKIEYAEFFYSFYEIWV